MSEHETTSVYTVRNKTFSMVFANKKAAEEFCRAKATPANGLYIELITVLGDTEKYQALLTQAEAMAQSIEELIEHFAEERKFAERGRWKTVEIDLKKLINLDNVLSDWQKFKGEM